MTIHRIHDIVTGEITEIPYTKNQMAEIEAARIEAQKIAEQEAAQADEKAALLAKLGITEDEARLLLGGN